MSSCSPVAVAGSARAEDGGSGFGPDGVGRVDQGRIAVAPLEGVLEPADLPAVGGAPERVLVPAVLGVMVIPEPVREPVPRDVVEDAVRLIPAQGDMEVGVLVH